MDKDIKRDEIDKTNEIKDLEIKDNGIKDSNIRYDKSIKNENEIDKTNEIIMEMKDRLKLMDNGNEPNNELIENNIEDRLRRYDRDLLYSKIFISLIIILLCFIITIAIIYFILVLSSNHLSSNT